MILKDWALPYPIPQVMIGLQIGTWTGWGIASNMSFVASALVLGFHVSHALLQWRIRTSPPPGEEPRTF